MNFDKVGFFVSRICSTQRNILRSAEFFRFRIKFFSSNELVFARVRPWPVEKSQVEHLALSMTLTFSSSL